MTQTLAHLLRTCLNYPASVASRWTTYASTWLVAIVLLAAVSEEWLTLPAAMILLSVMTLLIVVLAMRREVHTVHVLVNNQRDELLNRISDLIDALRDADVKIPEHRDNKTSSAVIHDAETSK